MKLIDKSAVVAEIERRIAFFSDINSKQAIYSSLDCAIAFAGLRDFINTLEVKNVEVSKNQEWSADDERNLNAVLSFIDDEYLRRWLKDVVHERYDEQQVKD